MENEPFYIFVVHQSNFVTCSYALRLLVLQFMDCYSYIALLRDVYHI